MQIRITLAPHKSVIINLKVNHRHFAEWLQNSKGALVILPDGLRLCFTDRTPIIRSPKTVAYDFNFKRVVFARDNGELLEVDLTPISDIQQHSKDKRESVQKTIPKNLAKAQKLIKKHSKREHNRVQDALHKQIHGKESVIAPFIEGYHLGIEDLSKITGDILKDDHGKKFNSKMSRWFHGAFRDIITHHHPDSEPYYTRMTSKYCPFCGSYLSHPTWTLAVCPKCGSLDRDHMEAVSGLVRTIPPRHKKGQPWKLAKDVLPQEVVERLYHKSRSTNVDMGSSQPQKVGLFAPNVPSSNQPSSDIDISHSADVMLENRNDAVPNQYGGMNKLVTMQRLVGIHDVCIST